MPDLTLGDRSSISDFVYGLTLMGTGGGGSNPAQMIELMEAELDAGGPFQIVDVGKLPPDAWTATVAGLGGRPPENGPSAEELRALGLIDPRYTRYSLLAAAIQELEKQAGVRIQAIVPGELGSWNTPAPMLAGRQLGIPVIDGDYAGRAIPEIGQTVPDVLGRNNCPFSFVDRWGNAIIVREATSPAMIDRIGRMFCLAGYGGVSFAGFLSQAREVPGIFVSNTLSRALSVGRAGRLALAEGTDPSEAMAKAVGGWVLFKGVVDRTELDDREAYMFGYGTHFIRGTGPDAGHLMRVWYKNEHHLSWLDDQAWVTSPDCLAIVEVTRGEPLPNNSISPGQPVAVIGWPAHAVHRTARGVEVLGPRHFGFDLDFVPIEQRLRDRGGDR